MNHTPKPTVFIQASEVHRLSAKVSEFSLKHHSADPEAFDVRIMYLEDFPQLWKRDGQKYRFRKKDKFLLKWRRKDYSQAFVPLRFAPPSLMNFKGKAIVIDPDIFAAGDINELFNRDMQNKAIVCKKIVPPPSKTKNWVRPPHYVSSVMLLDCSKLKHWNLDERLEQLFSLKLNYQDWINLKKEPAETLGEFPGEWNHYDTLDETTKLLHNTRRITQPWKTGLPYDRIIHEPKRVAYFIPEHWMTGIRHWLRGEGYLPHGYYQPHPDPNQEKFFFSLLAKALEEGFISKSLVQEEIKLGRLRPDAPKLLEKFSSKRETVYA